MVEIIENKENKLLGRKELVATIPNEGATPTRFDVKKAIAKKLKVKEDLVIINKMQSYYGDSKVNIKAKIYNSKESLERHARPHMVKRNSPKPVEGEGEE